MTPVLSDKEPALWTINKMAGIILTEGTASGTDGTVIPATAVTITSLPTDHMDRVSASLPPYADCYP